MRFLVFLALIAVAVAAVVHEEDYSAYFKDEAQLKSAMACLLDKAPCGKLQGLKSVDLYTFTTTVSHANATQYTSDTVDKFPKIMKDDCGSCAPNQKAKYDVVKQTLQEQYPQYYKALKNKYS